MMTHIQYLLCKLAEECNEAAQRALKQQQFGPQQRQKGYRKNKERLRGEVLDVLAHVRFLQQVGEIDEISEEDINEHAARKWRKCARYEAMSRRNGYVR